MRGCAALTVAGFLLVPLAPAQAASRDLAGNATAFYLEYVSIPQNSTMVYQTTALTAGADPVLHLLRDNGAGGWTQVAYNVEDYLCLMLSYQRTFDCGGPATPIVTD